MSETPPQQQHPIKLDQVIAAFLKNRAEMAAMAERHEAEMKPLQDKKAAMEKWLLAKLNDTGQKSAKTEVGTASRVIKTTFTVADWEAFWQFVKDRPDVAQFLPQRVNATAVQEFIDQSGGVPPGVGASSVVVVQVRKPT